MKRIQYLAAASAAVALAAACAARSASTRKDTRAARALFLRGTDIARGSGGTIRGGHRWHS
jgi:hypothetical protein